MKKGHEAVLSKKENGKVSCRTDQLELGMKHARDLEREQTYWLVGALVGHYGAWTPVGVVQSG